MKKRLLALLLLPLLIPACNSNQGGNNNQEAPAASISGEIKKGEIGTFNLLTPANGFETDTGFTVIWEAANNADHYTLEICSHTKFNNDDEDEVYVKERNIYSTEFNLNYTLPKKDILYYWKVTASNKDHTKTCNEIGNFFFKAPVIDSIPIEIEDAQDWVLHKEGSYADIAIDRTNFFGNNKNSLAITFDKEHTNTGNVKSDGWIVITKTEDRELYGTDSFYFNFYYSGHDATVLIRVLDYDGEYWHNQVQISNNSKQTILMRYEDFSLRTQGTNIFNKVFDWQHIRYFEIVFERTFGDGICLLSDIKAVKYEDYKSMFIEKMDFRITDMNQWAYENYNFQKTISSDGSELTISYEARNAETNPDGFSGYGFQSIDVYKYMVKGDAIRMKVKYTGSYSSSNFYFRITEEDNDRWNFKAPFSYLIKNQYKELIIPLKAFQRMEYMNGDGAKQFYYVKKFSVGLADNYSSGSISIKDLEIIKLDDVLESRTRIVPENGCIEDFNNYDLYTQIYYTWDQSAVNKDEAMKLDTFHKTGGLLNKYCAEFDYKADMEMAVYQTYLDTSAVVGKNAFSIWLKDATPKSENSAFNYLSNEDVAAEMTIQLTMDSGEWYRYVIDKVGKDWQKYTILFSDFELNNESDLFDEPLPLNSEHIIHMAFGFKYLYYDQNGNHIPTYAIANPVYIDEIYLTNATKTGTEELSDTIKEDADDENRITVDSFEKYAESIQAFDYWYYESSLDYNSMTIVDEVSSQGGNNSMKMHYKGSTSVSYHRVLPFASTVKAKALTLDIKGDGKATVYLNLNWRNGTSLIKMRYVLTNIPTTWTHYELGLALFKDVNGSNKVILEDYVPDIETISFGITNGDNSESDIYVDNIVFRKDLTYKVNTNTAID